MTFINAATSRAHHKRIAHHHRRRFEIGAKHLIKEDFSRLTLNEIEATGGVAQHDKEFIVFVVESHRRRPRITLQRHLVDLLTRTLIPGIKMPHTIGAIVGKNRENELATIALTQKRGAIHSPVEVLFVDGHLRARHLNRPHGLPG